MRRKLLSILSAALLASCAPAFNRPAFLATFVGRSEDEVVRRLGVPSRTFEANGRKFLAYAEHRTEVSTVGISFGFGGFDSFGTGFGYSPSQVIDRGCETTFEVANGRVLTWSLRGNAC